MIALLQEHHIRYCVIGGQGVNAYAEPLVSLDLDLVVAVDQLHDVEKLLSERCRVERFPRSLIVSAEGSQLKVQIQTDPRYLGGTRPGAPSQQKPQGFTRHRAAD